MNVSLSASRRKNWEKIEVGQDAGAVSLSHYLHAEPRRQDGCSVRSLSLSSSSLFLRAKSRNSPQLLFLEMQDRKPDIGGDDEEVLKISLAHGGSEPVTVRAKATTLVSKLINAYASSAGINAASIRLATPDGDRMNAGQNLGFYNIEDGDQVDVMIEQIGGAAK